MFIRRLAFALVFFLAASVRGGTPGSTATVADLQEAAVQRLKEHLVNIEATRAYVQTDGRDPAASARMLKELDAEKAAVEKRLAQFPARPSPTDTAAWQETDGRPAPADAPERSEEALDAKIREISSEAQPLEKVLAFLRDNCGVNVQPDWKSLESATVDRKTPIDLNLREVTLAQVLRTLCSQLGGVTPIGFESDGNVIHIATVDDLRATTPRVVVVYNVRALIAAAPAATKMPTDAQKLVELLKTHVTPDDWDPETGRGSITEYHGLLTISAVRSTHRQVRELLAKLRQAGKPTPSPGGNASAPADRPR